LQEIITKLYPSGKKEATKSSAHQIKAFVDFYHINMEEFEPSDINAYPTFEDFFIRHHAPGSRPIFAENDPSKAVVVADSRVVVYPSVSETQALWIKGKNFTIENLILDAERAKAWSDGAVASFRLSPQDYHRYHSPCTGRVTWFKPIGGDYYQVDPLCVTSKVDILTRNARCCLEIETREFGKVLFVAIGATNVGTVEYVIF
jgi:phosphatidylserine decarboxylase